MLRKPVVLITGASGEMGYGLIQRLADHPEFDLLGLDIRELPEEISTRCAATIAGDILDQRLLDRLVTEYEIHGIFHLAALLSTRAEFSPETAHEVNVTGTLRLLKLAVEQARWHGRRVKFMFPSSIAAYGLPDLATKTRAGRVGEDVYNLPTTMYGCNKLYCEHLGRYYSHHYRQLAAEDERQGVDFRSIRFPGLISAFTIPSGGTSDYGPEMVHAAAQGKPYACFVREDTRIPFMAMPDAIDALLRLMEAPAEKLTRDVYNIGAFSPSAAEFAERTRAAFPGGQITFEPDRRRQGIVDSWPLDVDDRAARTDWGFAPSYDFARTFDGYLVPEIRARYRTGSKPKPA
ncbi:MAG: NAD-dependent epimerase/dehydratase family protein [Deltaproteobacteria bacterium]|nr:NAD-dependent epimerase/dehydratase family protein [Deltaproteobacteria bacterium]